ncbi:hypothetical protein [Alkalicoccus daliensis]|uniref:Uncharacterized protein n=1 Tax=Alkalicoccus daliensis TaxID=745820 RepID=A0A1H0HLF9_9BACI|nr:hypothetical protein [Alkalicoccus daliensis]SDO19661.1 hypothetical protein SAMN04488053_108139 [Alkalicoccus daliensis]
MEQKITSSVLFILLLSLLTACNGNAASDEGETNQNTDIEAAEEETQASEEEAALEEEIEELEAEMSELETLLERQEEKVNTLENQLEVSQERSDTLKDQLEESRETASAAAEELRELESLSDRNYSLRGDGFYTQVWMNNHPPEEMEGWEPGTTEWQPSNWEIENSFTAGTSQYSAPERLIFDWLSAEGLLERKDSFDELAIRTKFISDSEAEILVLEWGLRDDATAGNDYLFHMKKENEAWGIAELEERYHCRRGISEENDEELCK